MEQNRDELVGWQEGDARQLDVSVFDLKHAECSVRLDRIEGGRAYVTVTAVDGLDARPWRHDLELTMPEEAESDVAETPVEARADPNSINGNLQ